MMKIITSMTRSRFDELRQGIIDGSIAEQLDEMIGNENKRTKKQLVRFRQIAALINIVEQSPDTMKWLVSNEWQELRLIKSGLVEGAIDVAVKCKQDLVIPPLRVRPFIKDSHD